MQRCFSEIFLKEWSKAPVGSPDLLVTFDQGLVAFDGGFESPQQPAVLVNPKESRQKDQPIEGFCRSEMEEIFIIASYNDDDCERVKTAMKKEMGIHFKIVEPHTAVHKITVMVQPVHATRTVPAVVVTSRFRPLAYCTLFQFSCPALFLS